MKNMITKFLSITMIIMLCMSPLQSLAGEAFAEDFVQEQEIVPEQQEPVILSEEAEPSFEQEVIQEPVEAEPEVISDTQEPDILPDQEDKSDPGSSEDGTQIYDEGSEGVNDIEAGEGSYEIPAVEETQGELPAEEPDILPEEDITEQDITEEVTEEPAAELPAIEEVVPVEPEVQEETAPIPTTEEPAEEEPVTEEPVAEEPAAEPASEEPAAIEPVVEEPVATEPAEEEILIQEESIDQDGAPAEEVTEEETTEEEEATDEPKIEEDEEIYYLELEESYDIGVDSDTLLSGYIGYGDGGSLFGQKSSNYNGGKLEGVTAALYSEVKSTVTRVATAQQADTTAGIVRVEDTEALSLYSWTAEDLGVEDLYYINDSGKKKITDEAKSAILAIQPFCEVNLAVKSMIRDCPYEMFWFGNKYVTAYSCSFTFFEDPNSGDEKVRFSGLGFVIKFQVSVDYWDNDIIDTEVRKYTTDLDKIGSIQSAITNAGNLVAEANNHGYSDIGKMSFFKDSICDLNTYNSYAAHHVDDYGNPWQIIYLFDGDPETNVVCEGYAKGFQYLCDESGLSDANVYCVSGTMKNVNSSGSGEGHLWNIVHMDGHNYLVDVTNCDNAYPNDLFMARPVNGDIDNGYVFKFGSGQLLFTYSDDTWMVYSDEELYMERWHEYDEDDFCIYCGEFRDPWADYYFPIDESWYALPGWWIDVNGYFGYHAYDQDHPDGFGGQTMFTEAVLVPLEGDTDAITLDPWNNEYGWHIEAHNLGSARLDLYYNDYNGNPVAEPYSVWIYVEGEVWTLWLGDNHGMNRLVKGESMDIMTDIYREFYTPSQGNQHDNTLRLYDPVAGTLDENATNISYQWQWLMPDGEGSLIADNDSHLQYFTVSESALPDGYNSALHIAARMDAPIDTNDVTYYILLDALRWTEGSDQPERVADAQYEIHIQGGYTTIEPAFLEDAQAYILPGDSFTLTPQHMEHYINELGQTTVEENTDVLWTWEWDPDKVSIKDTFGNELTYGEEPDGSDAITWGQEPFTITKLKNEWTTIRLNAETLRDTNDPNSGYYVATYRNWDLPGSDVRIEWPNDLPYDGGNNFYLYEDGIQELVPVITGLEASGVDPEDLTYEWTVGLLDDEGDFVYTLLPGMDMEYVGQGYVPRIDHGINLIGSALKASLPIDERSFNIRLVVKYNGQELAWNDIWVNLRDVWADYRYPIGDWAALPGWTQDFDSEFICWVEDADHPGGEEVWVWITDVSVEMDDESDPDAVTAYSWEDGCYWHIDANKYGHGWITLTYTTYYAPYTSSITESETFEVWVGHDVWNLWISSSTGEGQILPGASLDLIADFHHDFDYPETEDTNAVIYVWEGLDDWDDLFNYTADANDPSILHVTAKEDAPNGSRARVALTLEKYDENGDSYDVAYQEVELLVNDDYTSILPVDLDYYDILPGQSIVYTPELHRYYLDDDGVQQDEILIQGIRCRWEWDPAAVRITDATGQELTYGDEDGNGAYIYGQAPFTITKLNNWDQNITIITEDDDEFGNYYENCRRGWHLDSIHPDFRFEDLHWDNPDAAHIYEDENFYLCPTLDWIEEYFQNHNLPADYTIDWQIGEINGAGEYSVSLEEGQGYTYASDGKGIILNGSVLKNYVNPGTDGVSITAALRVGDETLEWANLWMSVWECIEDYQYPLDNWSGLPGWWYDFDSRFNCHVEDAEHTDDNSDFEVHIVDAYIDLDEGLPKDAITVEPWEDGNGWHIQANHYGHGVLTIKYTTYEHPEDESITEQKNFDIWIGHDVWRLWISDDTGTNQLLPGGSMNLEAGFSHDYDYEAQGDPNTISYEWTVVEGSEYLSAYNTVQGSPEKLHVTASDNAPNGAHIRIRVTLNRFYQEQWENNVASSEYDIWINNDYIVILPADLEYTDILPGQSVEYTPELWHYYLDAFGEMQEEDLTDSASWRWEWDPDAEIITDKNHTELTYGDEEGNGAYVYGEAPFTITKRNNWEQNIRIIAEQTDNYGNLHGVCWRDWHLDSVNPDFHFEDLHWDGGNAAHIYEDEIFELCPTLDWIDEYFNNHNLNPYYTVEWQIGLRDGDGSYIYVLNSEEGFTYAKDGKGIILDGSVLKNHVNPGTDGVDITARLMVSDQELARADLWMSVWECVYDFHSFPGDWQALPGWDRNIDLYSDCYVENGEYPWGQNLPVYVTNVTVDNYDQEANSFTVNHWNENDNWHVQATGEWGGALVSIYYTLDGEPVAEPYTFEAWVGSDVYDLWLTSSTCDNRMLPGASIDLTANIYRHSYDSWTGGEYEGDTSDIIYTVETFDPFDELFTLTKDGNVFRITAKADAENRWTNILVRALRLDENAEATRDDNYVEVASCWYSIGVMDDYLYVDPIDDQFDLAPGQSIELETQLHRKYLDDEGVARDEVVSGDIRWRWEWDENAVQITDGQGKVLDHEEEEGDFGVPSFTVKKLKNWFTTIILNVEMPNENGDYENCLRWAYDLHDVNLDFWVTGLRAPNENKTCVYDTETGENAYIMGLDLTNLDELGLVAGRDYDIIWSLGYMTDNGFDPATMIEEGHGYTIIDNGKKIAIDGVELKKSLAEGEGGVDVGVAIRVDGIDEDISRSDLFWLDVRETVYDYYIDSGHSDILPKMAFYIPEICECYIDDVNHPFGEFLEYTVTNVTITNEEDFVLTFEPTMYGAPGWRIKATDHLGATTEAAIYYTDIYGNPVEVLHAFTLGIVDDVWFAWIDTSSWISQILPGDSVDLIVSANHLCYDPETGERIQGDYNITWEWEPVDEPVNWYEVFDSVQDADDPSVLHVTAKPEYRGYISCGIDAIAYLTDENGNLVYDENGNKIERTRTNYRLEKSDNFMNMEPTELEKYDLHPGETLTIDPMVYHYYLDQNGAPVVEPLWAEYIKWNFGWDDAVLEITDSTGKVLTQEDNYGTPPFTLKKLQSEGTDFTLFAYTPYMTEHGWSEDYTECFRRTWSLYEAYHEAELTSVPAKAPTLDAVGNIACYRCEGCGQYFSDAEGLHPLTEEQVFIPKLIHINTAVVSGIVEKTYNGSAQTQTLTLKVDGVSLTAGTDYKVAYAGNTNAGQATIAITGMGKYGGTRTEIFTIKPKAITPDITLSAEVFAYDGTAKKPTVTVKDGDTILASSDYTVGYSNNINVGFAAVAVIMKGNYSGTGAAVFKIIYKGIVEIDGKWYYYNDAGERKTGFIQYGGKYYYFNPSTGAMQFGFVSGGGKYYYFSKSNGAMQFGFVKDGNNYYYFSKKDGTMQVGFVNDGGYYYFDKTTGKMKVGFVNDGGNYYFSKTTGKMQFGWVVDSNKYYYFSKTNGKMQTGWAVIDSKYYYFDPATGAMKTGWLKYSGKYYYLSKTTGNPVTGKQTIDGTEYTFGSDGALIV